MVSIFFVYNKCFTTSKLQIIGMIVCFYHSSQIS